MKYYKIYATDFNEFSIEIYNNGEYYGLTKLSISNLINITDLLYAMGFEDQTDEEETDFE